MPESQNRIDSIITLMVEEAETMDIKEFSKPLRLYHVLMKVSERVMKIMRTME